MKPKKRQSTVPKKPTAADMITSLCVYIQQPRPETAATAAAATMTIDDDDEHQDLFLESLTEETVKQLQSYPNVTHFEMISLSLDADQLATLLFTWKRNLTCLTVHIVASRTFDLDTSLISWKDFLGDLPKVVPSLKQLRVEDANLVHYMHTQTVAYLADPDQFFCLPKKLKLVELYFGLPLAYPTETSTALTTAQWRGLTRLALVSLSSSHLKESLQVVEAESSESQAQAQPFQLPLSTAAQLTHYSMINEMFFECSPYATMDQLPFTSLTHLQLKTMLPLEQFLANYSLAALPQLQYLALDNQSGLRHLLDQPDVCARLGLKRKVPEDELVVPVAAAVDSLPVYVTLRTLKIYNPPHVPAALAQFNFPALQELHLSISSTTLCHYCSESSDFRNCHSLFYSSFQEWPGLEIYYDGREVKLAKRTEAVVSSDQ